MRNTNNIFLVCYKWNPVVHVHIIRVHMKDIGIPVFKKNNMVL